MGHTLITFLGKASTEYDTVDYRFNDVPDDPFRNQRYFGTTLLKYLNRAESSKKPETLVVLGTKGSMWDALYYVGDSEKDDGNAARRYALADKLLHNSTCVEGNEMEIDPELRELEGFLAGYYGLECKLETIGYGRDLAGQLDIVGSVAKLIPEDQSISLDITHGLRHLPVLVVLIALYLQSIKKAVILGIYYGAYELRSHNEEYAAPVLKMDGLLHIADWIAALKTFDKDGDYGVFADLLKREDFPSTQSKWLEEAAFLEHTMNLKEAKKRLDKVAGHIDKLSGVGGLFSEQLRNRISWHSSGHDEVNEARKLYLYQLNAAKSYLDKRDYLRATIFGLEAFVTTLVMDEVEKYNDYHTRDNRRRDLINRKTGIPIETVNDFLLLDQLRNRLAHGSTNKEPKDNDEQLRIEKIARIEKIEQSLESEPKLRSFLQELFKKLFSDLRLL